MGDLEQTQKFISIQLLQNILMDTNTFFNFVSFDNHRDIFPDNLNEYIQALNHYVKYKLDKNETMNLTEIERMNTINKFFHADYPVYQQNKDLFITTDLLTISHIESILNDSNVFNKFLHFNENRDIFIRDYFEYIDSIKNYVSAMEEHNIILPPVAQERFNQIINLSLEHSKKNPINEIIDTEFEQRLFQNIPRNYTGVALAWAIYTELAKLVQYDDMYSAAKSKDVKDAIYNQSIADITLSNNKITCNTWAQLYASILKKCGIDAYVNKDTIHKYVIMNINDKMIIADATNSFIDEPGSMKLNDITRIKLGIHTCGFASNSPNFNDEIRLINEKLMEDQKQNELQFNSTLYQYQQQYQSNKVSRISHLKSKIFSFRKNKNGIDNKIQEANWIAKSKNLDYTSAITYIRQYLKVNLNQEEQNGCNLSYVRINMNGNYRLNILIENKVNNNSNYYLYQEDIGCVKVDNMIVQNLIQNGEMSSIFKEPEVTCLGGKRS